MQCMQWPEQDISTPYSSGQQLPWFLWNKQIHVRTCDINCAADTELQQVGSFFHLDLWKPGAYMKALRTLPKNMSIMTHHPSQQPYHMTQPIKTLNLCGHGRHLGAWIPCLTQKHNRYTISTISSTTTINIISIVMIIIISDDSEHQRYLKS